MRITRLSLLVLALAAAGCQAPRSDRIVLRVANWGGAKEGNEYDRLVEQIIRDFERENPGVEIREESVPGEYVAKMTLAFIAKSEPDIMMLDASSSALFIDNGMVADLTPLIDADRAFSLDAYFPNVVNIARRGKSLYAIPQDFTTMVVYYNKRLFDRAGVPYPTADWDFAKFRDIAKRLTIPGKSADEPATQYGFSFSNWAAGWVMWLWNNGADHMAPDGKSAQGFLDSPKAAEAVGYLRDLILVDRAAPSISQTAAMGVDLFANGQAAMTVSGHWALVGYKAAPKGPDGKPKITWDDIGVVSLPHNVPQSQTVMYESGYAIGAHSRHRELAWKFIKYMTSHDVQSKYQSSGIAISARKDVAAERAAASRLEAAFLPTIPTARPPYGSRIEGYEFVEEQMQKAMDSVLQSGKDPARALAESARAVDREFAKR